jgi:hypothetical protein
MNLERTTKLNGPEPRRCDYGIYASLGRALGDTDMQAVSSQASHSRSGLRQASALLLHLTSYNFTRTLSHWETMVS